MSSLRRLWLRLHRWFALGIGWLLAAVGVMGAILVVARPLDAALHPELFRARGGGSEAAASFDAMHARLAAQFGPKADFTFRPPREPGESLWVLVRGAGAWSGTVYLDPASGDEQGRRGESEGFVNVLFKLHSSLLLQETGKAVLAWVSLGYLLLLVTGLVLWWPRRWPPSLRIEWRKGLLRGLFDLHRTAGALLGLVIAVSVATGAYMAWRPLGAWISALAGAEPVRAPSLPKQAPPEGTARPTLDAMLATARAEFDGAPVGYLQVPAAGRRPVRVRLMAVAGDPHPNGLTSVWLDPRDGRVLAAQRWDALDPGSRAVAVIYPLHTGELGGPALEAVAAVSGLALGTLGISGIWLWWRRRPAATVRPRARAPSSAPR